MTNEEIISDFHRYLLRHDVKLLILSAFCGYVTAKIIKQKPL
jgi:hypothetical protein